MVFFNLKKT